MTKQTLVPAQIAAEMVGVKRDTIRKWVFRGYLKPVAVGDAGRRFFAPEDVYACALARRDVDFRIVDDDKAIIEPIRVDLDDAP